MTVISSFACLAWTEYSFSFFFSGKDREKMDDVILETAEEWFSVEEIDIDYEFDAPKYYDFSRPETDLQAGEAELWFESAGSCIPSRKPLDLHFLSPI